MRTARSSAHTLQLLPAALPTLDIAEGALDSIFRLYKQLLPKMGGYLTHAGELNRPRLELMLAELAALEQQTLEQRAQVGTGAHSTWGVSPMKPHNRGWAKAAGHMTAMCMLATFVCQLHVVT